MGKVLNYDSFFSLSRSLCYIGFGRRLYSVVCKWNERREGRSEVYIKEEKGVGSGMRYLPSEAGISDTTSRNN